MSDHCVLIESALMQTNCLLKSYANSLFNKTEIIPQALMLDLAWTSLVTKL